MSYAVATATDEREAVELIATNHPAVTIIDIDPPGPYSTKVATKALKSSRDTAIVIYAARGGRALLLEALDYGCTGFVLKGSPLEDLLRAVRAVTAGSTYIDPTVAYDLAEPAQKTPTLTEREREILRLLSDGLDNSQIGQRLHISPETARTHLRKAMRKLRAATRTQAVARALREQCIQ